MDDQGGVPAVAKLSKTVPLFGMPVVALDLGQTVQFEIAVPGPGGEAFVVSLQENPTDPGLLRFADQPVPVLRPAVAKNDGTPGGAEWLEPDPAPAHAGVHLTGNVALRIGAAPGGVAQLEAGPPAAGPQIVHLTADPPTVLLGDTGFALDLSGGVYLDADASAAPPQAEDPTTSRSRALATTTPGRGSRSTRVCFCPGRCRTSAASRSQSRSRSAGR